jgi:hypothetical protein
MVKFENENENGFIKKDNNPLFHHSTLPWPGPDHRPQKIPYILIKLQKYRDVPLMAHNPDCRTP